MSENPYRIVECPHCHEEVSVKSFETERRIHLETIERLHREIAALRRAATDEPGLRAAIRAAWDRAASNTSAGDCIELEDLLAATPTLDDRALAEWIDAIGEIELAVQAGRVEFFDAYGNWDESRDTRHRWVRLDVIYSLLAGLRASGGKG